jgi:hypothetical protein
MEVNEIVGAYVISGEGGQINAYVVLVENVKERNLLEDIGVDRRIVLKWILNKMGGCGLHSSGSG